MVAISDAPIAATYEGTIYGWAEFSRQEGFFDYEVESGQVVSPEIDGVWGEIGKQRVLSAIRKRHFGKWNAAFCDGHVQIYKTKELFDYRNDAGLSLRNKDNLPHREIVPSVP
jgi:prepilin-type processing-associated H-X9-DG protein